MRYGAAVTGTALTAPPDAKRPPRGMRDGLLFWYGDAVS